MRCSTPSWVALSLMGDSSRLASLSGRWAPSVGEFGRSPIECRIALSSMPSMDSRYCSLKTPRWVARYFDFRSCSTTKVLYVGLSFLLENEAVGFLTSLVMYACCFVKSTIVLMFTPSILYDLLGGRYLLCGVWECDGVDLFL